jgi:cell division initiation protein
MSPEPFEIQNVKLRRQLLGYDPDAVERLLEEVARSFEDVRLERDALREQVAQLRQECEKSTERDRRVGDVLVSAQRIIEKWLADARKRADTILEEAREDAERILAEARREPERLQDEIGRLETIEQALRERYRAFLSGAQHLLDGGLEEADGGSGARADLARTSPE